MQSTPVSSTTDDGVVPSAMPAMPAVPVVPPASAAASASFERRRAAGSAAEQALALYRAIFVNAPEAIAIVDTNGRYLEQNAAHLELIGYSDEELRGQTPAVHLGDTEFQTIVAELVRTGTCHRECVSRSKAGREMTIELSAFAVREADGEPVCYVGVKRDVTSEKQSAVALQHKFEELQAIYRMSNVVSRAGALEEIYNVALDELQRTVHTDRASVLLYDDARVMRFKAWRGLSAAYRRAVEGHSPWSPDDPDPQPVLIGDVRADPHLTELLPVFEREGIVAIGFIPLVSSGRLLGKFMIYFDRPHELSAPELQIAQTIASHIAFAIARKADETALRESWQAHRLLAEAGALLNSSLDVEDTLASITRLAVPAIADWCIVDLSDDKGGFKRIAVASGDGNDAIARRLLGEHRPLDPTSVSRVAQSGRAEINDNVDDEFLQSVARDAEQLETMRATRITSYISAPLVTRGRTIGVLTFATSTSGRRYSNEDVWLAEELARRAAVAVDNARLYREAQEANRAKSQFLATMSHELRTPLNAIGGYAELLQMGLRGPLSLEQQDDVNRIQRSQRHLLGLINDLLSFAKIESGHLELHIERVLVDDALLSVESLIQPQVQAKPLHYSRIAGDPSVVCTADLDKLQQVLANLLSNAVKFTPAGGSVTVAWEASDQTVSIRVTDTGPGIPSNKLEAIFEPFVQLGGNLTRVAEGTGLGLAISRELARAMGGDVTVASTFGAGATFTLTLPRA
jgi:PAS domain S-box-containing protein